MCVRRNTRSSRSPAFLETQAPMSKLMRREPEQMVEIVPIVPIA
jgi:hypothetical protein